MLFIIIDAIKLLNVELAEMDATNYKTDWMISYLKDFAKKTEVPFTTLMKILRNVLSGVKVNMQYLQYYFYYFHRERETTTCY